MATILGNTIKQFVSETNTTPVWTNINRTDGTLDDALAYTQSDLVDPTRQGAEQVATEGSVSGSIESEFQLSDAGFQILLKSLMQNTYTTASISATASFSGTDITDDATGGAFADIEVGDYFVPFGAALNGDTTFVVTAKADDDTLSLSPSPQAESAQSISFDIKSITNAATEQEMAFQERIATESDTLYNTFNDVLVSSMEVSATTGSILTTSTALIGRERLDQVTQVAGATDATAVSSRVIGSVRGFEGLFIDNAVVPEETLCPTEATVNIDNGSTAEYCMGNIGAHAINNPSISVTGSLITFVDPTSVTNMLSEKTKSRNETKFALGIAFKDSDGNRMIFDMPYCIYTELTMPERSNGTSLKNNGTFSADGKGALGYTVKATYLAKP